MHRADCREKTIAAAALAHRRTGGPAAAKPDTAEAMAEPCAFTSDN